MESRPGTDAGVFPARAGVIRDSDRHYPDYQRFPRTRGGDPDGEFTTPCGSTFSPHARGAVVIDASNDVCYNAFPTWGNLAKFTGDFDIAMFSPHARG